MYLLLLRLLQQGFQVVGMLAILLSEGTEFLYTLLHGLGVLLRRAYGFRRPCTLRVAVNTMVEEKQQTMNTYVIDRIFISKPNKLGTSS